MLSTDFVKLFHKTKYSALRTLNFTLRYVRDGKKNCSLRGIEKVRLIFREHSAGRL